MGALIELAPAVPLEPGIARWPPDAPLPEAWWSSEPAQLECELCGRVVFALWPLLHYPPDPDFGLVESEWMICRQCAEAVRPP